MGIFDWLNDTDNSSKSTSTTVSTTTTSNSATDNRIAAEGSYFVEGGGVEVVTTNTTLDGKVVDSALTSMQAALEKAADAIKAGDASSASGYSALLDSSTKMIQSSSDLFKEVFGGGMKMVKDVTTATTDAYRDAVTTTQATIDNKTIVTLGLAAAAAFGIWAYSRKG